MSLGPTPKQWKLTRDQMVALRQEYTTGTVGLRDLATKYETSYGVVHRVVSGDHPGVSGGNLCRPQGTRPRREYK